MNPQLNLNFPDTSLTFADFFSGCGGLSLGFIKAGLKCISAFEINDDAAWTYWYNLCYKDWSHLWLDPNDEKLIKKIQKRWDGGKTNNFLFKNGVPDNWLQVKEPMPCLNLFMMDITKLEPEEWMELCGVRPGDISTFAGGPPCQGFSTAGRREMFDERNQLALRFIYYAKICKPNFVLIENVPGLISLGRKKGEKEGPFVHWIREAFDDAGYDMEYKIHNAADFGVPQNRKRVLFFAVKKGLETKGFENLLFQNSINEYVTVREAIGELPPIQAGESYTGQPYGYDAINGHVICRSCLKYNKDTRTQCHNCKKPLTNPITGGVYKMGDMILLDTKNKIR